MRLWNGKLGLILVSILILAAGCHPNPTINNVHVSVSPSSPVVIASSFTQNYVDNDTNTTTTVTIQGAWAEFVLNLTNNNGTDIIITEITFTGTATSLSGDVEPINSVFSVSTMIPPPANTTQNYIIDVPAASGGKPGSATQTVYLQSLPCDTSSYDYNITATLIGWTGTATQPASSFTKTFYFTTNGPSIQTTCPTGS